MYKGEHPSNANTVPRLLVPVLAPLLVLAGRLVVQWVVLAQRPPLVEAYAAEQFPVLVRAGDTSSFLGQLRGYYHRPIAISNDEVAREYEDPPTGHRDHIGPGHEARLGGEMGSHADCPHRDPHLTDLRQIADATIDDDPQPAPGGQVVGKHLSDATGVQVAEGLDNKDIKGLDGIEDSPQGSSFFEVLLTPGGRQNPPVLA